MLFCCEIKIRLILKVTISLCFVNQIVFYCCCRGQTLISSARLKRFSWRSLMYSDFTLLFQQAGPFSERFPVSTMITLQPNKKMVRNSYILRHPQILNLKWWFLTVNLLLKKEAWREENIIYILKNHLLNLCLNNVICCKWLHVFCCWQVSLDGFFFPQRKDKEFGQI